MSKQNGLSLYDQSAVLRDAHNPEYGAIDTIVANNLVPARFSKVELTYIVSGNGAGEVGEALYYDKGEKQEQTVVCRNDELGSSHKTSLSFFNRTAQNLAGTYLIIYDDLGPVGIFFDVDGLNTPPAPSLVYRYITIAINSSDSEITIANKLVAQISLDAKFSAIGNQAFTVIFNTTAGTRTDSYDFNTNLYLRNTPGIDTNRLNSTYFTVNDTFDATSYYVWYNASGAGVDPLVPAKTGIPVIITAGDSAEKVAQATALALSPFFLTNNSDDKCFIINKLIGTSTRIQDVTSNMTSYRVDIAGVDKVLVAHLVLVYDISCDLVSVERI